MSTLGKALLVALAWFVVGSAEATTGVDWLNDRLQSNGSYAAPTDIANPFQGTAEAQRALIAVSQAASASSYTFLNGEPYNNTENLSRRIVAMSEAGQTPAGSLVDELLLHQNPDGSFGELAGYDSAVLDTAYALLALANTDRASSPQSSGAVAFLQRRQNADGSWSDAPSVSSAFLTALVVEALQPFDSAYHLASSLKLATDFLLSQRQADGLWSEDFVSAQCVLALAKSLADPKPMQSSIDALRERAIGDGSWSEDVFSTALAIRALAVADARGASSGPSNSTFALSNLGTHDGGHGAGETQTFSAVVTNQTASPLNAILVARVFDANGTLVGTVLPYATGTQAPTSDFSFAPNESKQVVIAWNPQQLPPGTYTLELDVVQWGSISRQVPTGNVLARINTSTTVASTQSFIGTTAFNPPLTQAGGSSGVDLQVLVVNSGNVALSGVPLTLILTPESGGGPIYTAQATLSQTLPIGGFAYVDFGQWQPTQAGNLIASVSATGGSVPGQITGKLYVGDVPRGTFAVTPTSVFTGNQTVHGNVNVIGVDTAVGVADPISYAIKQAVGRATQYLGPTTRNDQSFFQCFRCHVQTQTYAGLASLEGHDIGSDAATLQFLKNALTAPTGQDAEEPSALILWAFSHSQDKLGVFPQEYQRAIQLMGTAQNSGNTTHWGPDQPDSSRPWWFGNKDAITMMAAKGFADLLVTASNNDLHGLVNYSHSDPLPIGDWHGAGVHMSYGTDGNIYECLAGYPYVFTYDTHTHVYYSVAQLPRSCDGLIVNGPNDFYVAETHWRDVPSQIWHVTQGGAQIDVVTSFGADAIYDMVRASDGTVYISAAGNYSSYILRGRLDGTDLQTFLQDGPVVGAKGLATDASNNLYIANTGGHNILKVSPSGNVAVASDGFMYFNSPEFLSLSPDGTIYANQERGGVYVIRPDGTVRQHVAFSPMQYGGVVWGDGSVYVQTEDGLFYTLVQNPLDTSALPALSTKLQGIANFFIAESADNATNNIFQATRMIGLGEARRAINDSALLGQIDQTLSSINTVLRSRQHQDGGWGLDDGHKSDSIVTALVGLALDYMSPRPDDPVVQQAVNFLLGRQHVDPSTAGCYFQYGSWCSEDSLMVTNLSATGLVMDYLPHVYDRLAGLNIEVDLKFPSNVALANPDVPPNSVLPHADGTSSYTWTLPGVSSQGRTINFDLNVANLLTGESRPAASSATVVSTNSFDGSQVRVDLPIPVIHASDGLSLTSALTDKAVYTPNDLANLSALVGNSAPTSQGGTVVFKISAADGSVVAQLDSVAFTGLSTNASTTVSTAWSVGNLRAGTYTVIASLYDATGALADSRTTNLSMGSGAGPVGALRVTTNRQTYNTTDQVKIDGVAQDLSTNRSISGAAIHLSVTTPGGQSLLNQNVSLGEMAPRAIVERAIAQALSGAATGTYAVQGVLKDGAGNVLATSSTTFTVAEDISRSIVGSVAAQSATVNEGTPNVCNETVTNRGTLSQNVTVRHTLVRLDQAGSNPDVVTNVSLASGASQQLPQTIDTSPLEGGTYACALELSLGNNQWKGLASATFKVVPEPISLSTTVSVDRTNATYDTSDTVIFTLTADSLMLYRTVRGATGHVTVKAPGGSSIYSGDVTYGDMPAGSVKQKQSTYAFTNAVEGDYTVTTQLIAEGGVVATDNTVYHVQKFFALTGKVTAAQQSVPRGQTQTCTDVLSNGSTLHTISGLQVRQTLLKTSVTPAQILSSTTQTVDVPAGGTKTLTQTIDTGSLTEGQSYACGLDAFVDNQWKALDTVAFGVTSPLVKLTGNFAGGPRGRLLVLMDDQATRTGGGNLCDNGVVGMQLEAVFDPPLSPNATVNVNLLASGLVIDAASIKVGAFDGEVAGRVGSQNVHVAIPYVSADDLLVKLTGKNAQQTLGSNYNIVVTVVDVSRTFSFQTGLIDLSCRSLYSIGGALGSVFNIVGLGQPISGTPFNPGVDEGGLGDGVDTSSPAAQRAFLESVLQSEGWSYKIVMSPTTKNNVPGFAEEFRTGNYSAYALLSEYAVLSEQVQKELREAVYRGDGLLVAGRHDVRNHILDDVLGVAYKGHQVQPQGVQLLQSDIFTPGNVYFQQTGNNQWVQRVRKLAATEVGTLISPTNTTTRTEVAENVYRNGKSVVAAFDLLAESTLAGAASQMADILKKPLTYIHPSQAIPFAGRVTPVRLTLTNQGVATTGTATLTTSPVPGSYIVATSGGNLANGQVTWNYSLAANQTQSIDVWVSLPKGGVPATITASLPIQSGTYSYNGNVSYEIDPVTLPGLDKAIVDLSAYVASLPTNLLGQLVDPIFGTPPAKKALDDLHAADVDLTSGNVVDALTQLTKATDELTHDSSSQIPAIRLEVDEAILEVGQLQ